MLRLSFIILFSAVICAQSPHGEHFNIDCGECHTTEGWKIIPSQVTFQHTATKFPLTGQHQSVDCRQCHRSLQFPETGMECADCHKDIHQNTVGKDCAQCHETNSWLIADINELHRRGRFPLIGKHASAQCEDCHTGFSQLRFDIISIECISCHNNDYLSAKNPDHVRAGFSSDCSECHNISDNTWRTANINHDFFPLTGGHNISNCFGCHKSNTFTGLNKQCYSCHQGNFETAVNPDHQKAGFSTDCQSCHNINGWSPAAFDHSVTKFALTGAHISVSCSNCHSSGYSNTSSRCFSCHISDYDNTTNPAHASAGFSQECESCHNTNAWTPASFDHDGKYFPIYSGKHSGKWDKCSDCHTTSGNFTVFSCIDCHEHNRTETDDEHKEVQGYVYNSDDCYACHPQGNGEGGVNHSLTAFPLTGAHLSVNCADCHKNGYAGTPINCAECHNDDYQKTVNPSHQQLGLSTDCSTCHTTAAGWKPAGFAVHNNYYQFTGAHASISNDCASCHKGNYTTTPNSCYGCHQSNFTNAINPDHVNAGISTQCEECHTSSSWSSTTFQHISTGFELTGTHQPLQCSSCHKGTTAGLTGTCIGCHQAKYDSAPDHASQNYPKNCEMCHKTTTWNETDFNHSATNFPLTGVHINTDCSQCHQGGYSGTPVNCAECHNDDYQKTVNPSHQQLGLSNDCSTCHTTAAGWKPAGFAVHNNYYQLSGAHAAISNNCSSCHNGNYTTTPNTCYGCHTDDFNNSVNPSHPAAGFPTDCIECHSQTAWSPSTFDHDGQYFPIYTGKHAGKWSKCSDCHTVSNNFAVFSCIDCHEHNRTETDDHHKEVQGYAYMSTACLDCHPNGNGDKPGGVIR